VNDKRFVGSACKNCGGTERWKANYGCVACTRKRQRTPEQRLRTSAWYAVNKERHKEMRDNWRKENKGRIRKVNEVWRAANLKLCVSYTQAYNARKKRAMPAWAISKEIEDFYRACPEGHQVDHVIPLRGKTVSGLHVVNNLQYLPGVENNKKGNRYAA
jgi:hypothetical protein